MAFHSFEKGIAIFLSGSPGGPTAIVIYLSAGWSVGLAQSRYILEGEGGDQVCNGAATGLPLTNTPLANDPANLPYLTAAENNTAGIHCNVIMLGMVSHTNY